MNEPQRRSRPSPTLAVAAALTLAGALSLAQERLGQPTPFGRPAPPLRPMDAGVNDVSALSTSTRLIPADLRAPMDFDRVFQVTGPGGRLETRPANLDSTPGDGVFARVSGGLSYIFPRSTYVRTRLGDLPTLPPGGHYQLGLPGAERLGIPGGPAGPLSPATTQGRAVSAQAATPVNAVPMSTSTRHDVAPHGSSEQHVAPPARAAIKSLWTDETYRRARVGALLDQALAARS